MRLNLFQLSTLCVFKYKRWKYRHSAIKVFKYRKVKTNNCKFGGNNTLFEGVSLINCEIGAYSYIQKHSSLYQTQIGKFCSIADHVVTGFGSHPTNFVSTYPSFYYDTTPEIQFTLHKGVPQYNVFNTARGSKFLVEIGNDVWVGSHVLIMDGVKIGDGAIIAAGAVVTKDVEPYAIYGGVPAKLIKYRLPQDQIESLMTIKWWEKDVDWIKEHINQFVNTDEFIKIFAMGGEESFDDSQESPV